MFVHIANHGATIGRVANPIGPVDVLSTNPTEIPAQSEHPPEEPDDQP